MFENIISEAIAQKSSNKEVKRAIRAAGGDGDAEARAIAQVRKALGREVGSPVAEAPAATPTVPAPAPATRRGGYANRFPGRCEVTREDVPAGAGLVLKFGGQWCILGPTALASCVCPGDERKLLTAVVLAGADEDRARQELDHEDYSLLASVGQRMGAEALAVSAWGWAAEVA